LGWFAFDLQTQLDGFLDPHHQVVEGICLGVASAQRRYGGDVAAGFIAFDDDIKLAYAALILPYRHVGGVAFEGAGSLHHVPAACATGYGPIAAEAQDEFWRGLLALFSH
jgi:hypothetical protein